MLYFELEAIPVLGAHPFFGAPTTTSCKSITVFTLYILLLVLVCLKVRSVCSAPDASLQYKNYCKGPATVFSKYINVVRVPHTHTARATLVRSAKLHVTSIKSKPTTASIL